MKEGVGRGDLDPDVLVHALENLGELGVDICCVAGVA